MTDTPRFRRLERGDLTGAAIPLADKILAVSSDGLGGPFNLMLRSPDMAARLMAMIGYFQEESRILDPSCRRLAVLVLARKANADYAWWTHVRRARKAGEVSDDAIDAINRGERPKGLTPKQTATVDYVVELIGKGGVSARAHEAARAVMSEAEMVELIVFCGTYTTVAMLLREGEAKPPAGATELLLPVTDPFG